METDQLFLPPFLSPSLSFLPSFSSLAPSFSLPVFSLLLAALHPSSGSAAPVLLRAAPAALPRIQRTELGDLGAAASPGLQKRKAKTRSQLDKQVFVTAAL